MTARERILALKYLEKQNRNPDFARRLGVGVAMTENHKQERRQNQKSKSTIRTH